MFSFVFDKFSLKLSELIEQILTDNVIPSTDSRQSSIFNLLSVYS